MKKIKREKSVFSVLHFLLVLITSFLLFVVNMMAQEIDLRRAKGKVIAQGTNEILVEGDGFKVKSYRIEEIPLPESSESVSEDRKQKTNQAVAIRLVITGEFPSGVYAVWINGVPNPAYIGVDGNPQLIKISIGDGKMFEENSEVAISWGGIESKRVLLPEPFRVPSYLQRPARSKEELRQNVTLSYVDCDGSRLEKVYADCVLIGIYKDPHREFGQSLNQRRYLQIGNKEFATSVISVKEFEQLKDGEWIVVKTARGIYGGAMVGILDKSSLGKR